MRNGVTVEDYRRMSVGRKRVVRLRCEGRGEGDKSGVRESRGCSAADERCCCRSTRCERRQIPCSAETLRDRRCVARHSLTEPVSVEPRLWAACLAS